MKKSILSGAAILSLLVAASVSAGTVTRTYLDDDDHWVGWGDDTRGESIFLPKITDMIVQTTDGYLDLVTINFTQMLNYGLLHHFDSLFIGNNSSETNNFEYYVESTLTGSSSARTQAPGTYTLYNLGLDSTALDDSSFTTTTGVNPTYSCTNCVRKNHVNGYLNLQGSSTVSGLSVTYGSNLLTYNFTGLTANDRIQLNQDDFAISYMNSCANDVVIAQTPIPAPILLFGSALMGVFGFRKSKNQAV